MQPDAPLDRAVTVGDVAPDFTLEDQDGQAVSLGDLARGAAALVLYFYPKDDTPGCRVEACSFRDRHEQFLNAGARVVGISADSQTSHRRFIERCSIPFALLSDERQSVRKLFGVPKTLGLLPGRVTYVIDSKRVVRHITASQLRIQKHVDEALAVVRELTARASD
jgi:peroxiredoxin Q/BCP